MILLTQNFFNSSINNSKYTLIFESGCFGPRINSINIIIFCFIHNQWERLYTIMITNQYLYLLHCKLCGFISSSAISSLKFLSFAAKSSHKRWTNFQAGESKKCYILLIFFYACNIKFLVVSQLRNIILKRGICEKYHKMLVGILLTVSSWFVFHLDDPLMGYLLCSTYCFINKI